MCEYEGCEYWYGISGGIAEELLNGNLYGRKKEKEEEEVSKKEKERGTDGSDLYADKTERTKIVTHKGKEYEFKYVKPTWNEKTDAISEALIITKTDEACLKLGLYCRILLPKMLTKHPFNEPVEIALIKLDENVGSQLQEIVPPPFKVVEEKEDFTEPQ